MSATGLPADVRMTSGRGDVEGGAQVAAARYVEVSAGADEGAHDVGAAWVGGSDGDGGGGDDEDAAAADADDDDDVDDDDRCRCECQGTHKDVTTGTASHEHT